MKFGDLQIGDISRFLAVKLASPKSKYHVAVAPSSFFYINTSAVWPGSYPILKEEYPFLDHDSFIGCGQLVEYEEGNTIREHAHVMRLLGKTVKGLLVHLNRDVKTLSQALYRKVARHLKILLRTIYRASLFPSQDLACILDILNGDNIIQ